MMKKLLQWVLPAFIGIAPALGTDQFERELQEGQKALNQLNTIYSVNRTFQKGNDLIAFVSVTPQNGDPKVVKVKSIFNKIDMVDYIDGQGAYGQEVGELMADYDGTMLCERYTKPQILRYTEISSSVLTASINHTPVIDPFLSLKIIPFGIVADICQENQFQRPDQSIFKPKNDGRAIAKGLYKGAELTTLEDFFNLDFNTVVDVHIAAVPFGNDAAVSENDPILYQIFIKESLNQFSHWECGECYWGGNSFKGKKQYHKAIGHDYTTSYKQLMIRLPGKEDVAYPNGQREVSKTKRKNGNNNDSSGNHDNPRPEFTLI